MSSPDIKPIAIFSHNKKYYASNGTMQPPGNPQDRLKCATYGCNKHVKTQLTDDKNHLLYYHLDNTFCPDRIDDTPQNRKHRRRDWNTLQTKRIHCMENIHIFKIVHRRCAVCNTPTLITSLRTYKLYVTYNTIIITTPTITIDIMLLKYRKKNTIYPDDTHRGKKLVKYFFYDKILFQLETESHIYIDSPCGVRNTDTCENHLPPIQYPITVTENACSTCHQYYLDDTILQSEMEYTLPELKYRMWKKNNTLYVLVHKDEMTPCLFHTFKKNTKSTAWNVKYMTIPSRDFLPPSAYTIEKDVIRQHYKEECALCTAVQPQRVCRVCTFPIEDGQECTVCKNMSTIPCAQYGIQQYNNTLSECTHPIPNSTVKCIECGYLGHTNKMAFFTPTAYTAFQSQKILVGANVPISDGILYICAHCVKSCSSCNQLLPNKSYKTQCAPCLELTRTPRPSSIHPIRENSFLN